MGEIVYGDHVTAEEYSALRDAVGFAHITDAQAERGIAHTTFVVCARDGGRAVGMGRVLFDYGYTAYIGDVAVRPEYQGRGLGRGIVSRLLEGIRSRADSGDRLMVVLGAAKGKEGFYEKLGFKRRPNDTMGCGMTIWLESGPGGKAD